MTDLENTLWSPGGKRGGINPEAGTDMYTLLYIIPITSKDRCVAQGTLLNTLQRPTWKEKSLSHVRLFATPWTIQSMVFSRPEYWSGWPFPSPGDLPNSGIELRSPTLQADSLPAEPQGKSKMTCMRKESKKRVDICITDSLYCTFETNWMLYE